jgi:hypothetical protein
MDENHLVGRAGRTAGGGISQLYFLIRLGRRREFKPDISGAGTEVIDRS